MEKIIVHVNKVQYNHWEEVRWKTEEAYVAIGLKEAEMLEVMLSIAEQHDDDEFCDGVTITGLFVDPSTQNWVEFKLDSTGMVEKMQEEEIEIKHENIDNWIVDNLLTESGGSYGDVRELFLVDPEEFDDEHDDIHEENMKMGELIMLPISTAQQLNDAGINTKSASIENSCIYVADSVCVQFNQEEGTAAVLMRFDSTEDSMEARTNTDLPGIIRDVKAALHLMNVAPCKGNPINTNQEISF